MDKVSEFFKELKDRFSNPLFFSFTISWLVINWKIIIGLFFYSNSQLKNDGYSSYFDLIEKSMNALNFLWIPLLIALFYTFVFPIIRNWISMFNAWNQKWGTKRTLEIAKDGKISVLKYIALRDSYEKRIEYFDKMVEKESTTMAQNTDLLNEKSALLRQLQEKEKTLQDFKNINDPSHGLDGEWLIKTNSSVEARRVIINSGHIHANDNYEKSEELYKIHHFAYNNVSHELVVIIQDFKDLSAKTFAEIFSDRKGSFRTFRNKSNKGKISEMRRDD